MRTVSLPAVLAALFMLVLAPAAHAADGAFDKWAGIFIAGDYKAHSGADSEVFDNGRRDVAKAFIAAGLKPENTIQFSVRPERYATTPEKPYPSLPDPLMAEITKVTGKAKEGCIFFYTSHGSPQGVVMGDLLAPPAAIGRLIDRTCGTRPTVAIISACFSGVFSPILAGPNRVVQCKTLEKDGYKAVQLGFDDQKEQRLIGIALVALSAVIFGLTDGFSKMLAETNSVGQLVWARYALALPILIAVRPARLPTLFQTRHLRLQILRGSAPLVGKRLADRLRIWA